jgi:hypothetical protein
VLLDDEETSEGVWVCGSVRDCCVERSYCLAVPPPGTRAVVRYEDRMGEVSRSSKVLDFGPEDFC